MGNREPIAEITLDKLRHLRLDFNAMADFEKATNKNALKAIGEDMTASDTIALVWACLRHEDALLLQKDVGAMMDFGNITEVMGTIGELVKEAIPEEKPKKGKKTSPLA